MKTNILKKLIHTVSDNLKRNSSSNQNTDEYVFSSQDLDELKKNNIEKIKELKKDILKTTQKKEDPLDEIILNDSIFNKEKEEEPNHQQEEIETDLEPNNQQEEIETDLEPNNQQEKDSESNQQKEKRPSFINLEKEHQDLIMKKWEEIDLTTIEKDILDGKDILNHNYTITYADDAARFIHTIRKKYEIILCYLIGFNNEKKGIYEKTFFSDNIDNDWKYLNYYIKLLEKIKNFKIK